jgi:hypothetical protein
MSILLAAAASTLVFCAPGYPGAAGDAQPFVDEFAKAAVAAAGWPAGSLSAVYDPTEQGGMTKLGGADAVLAFVPYPFYVEHAVQLHLVPIAQADVVGVGTKEKWSLVAKTGRVTGGPSLAGYTIVSVAGYSPNFVLHSALSAWQVPAGVKVEPVGQILSALRRVASGDQVAALLDQTQATALPTLPFAGDLKVVVQSADVPVAIIAVVDNRLPAARAKSFQAGLLKLGKGPGEAEKLGALKLAGFVMPALPADAPVVGADAGGKGAGAKAGGGTSGKAADAKAGGGMSGKGAGAKAGAGKTP